MELSELTGVEATTGAFVPAVAVVDADGGVLVGIGAGAAGVITVGLSSTGGGGGDAGLLVSDEPEATGGADGMLVVSAPVAAPGGLSVCASTTQAHTNEAIMMVTTRVTTKTGHARSPTRTAFCSKFNFISYIISVSSPGLAGSHTWNAGRRTPFIHWSVKVARATRPCEGRDRGGK